MNLIERLCTATQVRKQIAGARDRLFRVALAWSGDASLADDLVQETLELGLKKSHQLRDPERLNAWLYSILNNCWKSHLRRYRPHEKLDETGIGQGCSADVTAGQLETVVRVRRAVAHLPVEQRRVLALVDLEGQAYCDVAEILGVPIGTVMSRLHRGRKALLALLGEQQDASAPAPVPLKRVK